MELLLVAVAALAAVIIYRDWSAQRRAEAHLTPASEAQGRQLFFDYNGAGYEMWHEGADVEYAALKVPRRLEHQWMRELTANYLAALDKPGNWRTVNFLHSRWDYKYVHELLAAEPLGDPPDKLVYMLILLDYVGTARRLLRASGKDRRTAGAKVLRMADELRAGVAARGGEPRVVEKLLERARRFAA